MTHVEDPAADELNWVAPIEDRIGNEAYEARFGENRTLRWTAVLLATLLVGSVSANVGLALRRPVTRYVRIDSVGHAQAIAYSDLSYTPQEGDIRHYLQLWAEGRYALQRATVAKTYKLSYDYVEEGLANRLMRQDMLDQVVPKVMTGQLPGNDILINSTQILSMGKQQVGVAIIPQGTAVIDLNKIYQAVDGASSPHSEHWLVDVTFYLNPEQVAARSSRDPQFETVNPLGLTITDLHAQQANR